MKNLHTPRLLPWFTLGAGLVGIGLRLWLQLTGIDFLGLYISGHPATTLLFILTALTLPVLVLCALPLNTGLPYRKLFAPSMPNLIGCGIAGLGILVTDLTELLQRTDVVTIATLALGIPAAVGLFFSGFCRLRGKRAAFLWRCLIVIYFTVHLLSQYRSWSSEPQLMEYFFPLLASVFLMLSSYFRATLEVDQKSRRWFVFSNQAALFFCMLSVIGEGGFFYLPMAIWAATELCSLKIAPRRKGMVLPANVSCCITTLEKGGHKAYAVGGCVRDSLLGLTPHDYDLCTDAKPEDIADIFQGHTLVRSGEKHGTIGVVIDGSVYEITTFRTEGSYTDGRHPDNVQFVTSVKDDLARRDFTVNAMAYSPSEGLIDPWGGRADLKAKVLRAVGDPQTRFEEDALRILRGVRFAVRFGLTPEEETEKAMFACAELMDRLARERVFDELCKLLPLVSAEDLCRYAPVVTQVIPELADSVDFDQHSPHHAFDVFTHIAHVTEAADADLTLRWAALLHDVGKPATFITDENGRGHFHGHAQVSAQMANEILLRLKAPNELRQQVVFLIEHHMTPMEPDKKLLRRRLTQYGIDNCRKLLALQRADFCSKGVGGNPEYFDRVLALLEEVLQENGCLAVTDLTINGRDLLALGYDPGPRIGHVLAGLLEQVQSDMLPNERQPLLDAAAAMKEEQP